MFSIHEIANFNKWEQDGNKLRVRLGHGLVVSLSTCAVFGDTSEWDEDFGRSTPFFNLFPTMKKIFTLILLSMIVFNAIHAEITWTLSDDGTLTISGTNMPDYDYDYYSCSAPWYSQCEKIKKVVIRSGVTSIGDYAFVDCSALTSITIPNSVTSIGGGAFYNCRGLTSITIPNSVTNIGSGAFYGTKWYDSQPDGLVYAGLCLYSYKGTMAANTKIDIKEGTKGITGYTFSNCSSLISITIPNSVKNIGSYAFRGCSGLTSVTIGNSVTSIGNSAFSGCSGLTSITIPNSVTSIGDCAFYDCSGLTSITIPNSVTSIGNSAFSGCSGLTSVTIGNSVTSIGNSAFSGCSGLASITIPNSVTSIGDYAFDGCSGLTSVTIGNSVTSIGGYAFRNCSGLTSVTIGNSVTNIGSYAFEDCSGLTSVTIGNSVTSIGNHAFSDAKLRNIVIKAKTPPYSGEKSFSGQSYYHTTLMIPEGCWDAYAYSDNWYRFINLREMAYNAVNLTNSKAYTMKSATEEAYLFYDSVNDCVGTLNETALDDTEANNTWMSVEIDGKHYVYNLGAKKFLVSDKNASKTGYSLSDTPVSIDVEDGKDAIVLGKGKEFYMVINEKLNVDEGLETLIMTSTGIKETSVDSNMPTVIYNLNGQRINRSHVLNGVYIKNGKKVIVK